MSNKRKKKQRQRSPRIIWRPRCRVTRSEVAQARIRESQCGRYRVRHTRFLLGPTRQQIAQERRRGNHARAAYLQRQQLQLQVLAQWFDGRYWQIISRHTRDTLAEQACERHLRTGGAA